jgi:hypothetical protein
MTEAEAAREEQIARNDAMFRQVNNQIKAVADQQDVSMPVPFVCECGATTCREVIRITRAGYEEVRSSPRWFMVKPAHVSAEGMIRTVGQRDGYVIVEKTGRGGEIAEREARDGGAGG